jgi:hypothetical protein
MSNILNARENPGTKGGRAALGWGYMLQNKRHCQPAPMIVPTFGADLGASRCAFLLLVWVHTRPCPCQ